MSRARFLRLLEAAEYLAAHSRGSRPDRPVPRRRHPDPHVRLFHLSCGAEHAAGGESARPRRDIEHAYLQFGREALVALGLPPGVHSYALLPIGYPMGRFGPVRRVPVADVVYEDRWGQP
jgi:hypothetical protein